MRRAELDTDDSGHMSWKSMLAFFRYTGLLLEYSQEDENAELLRQQLESTQDQLRSIVMADSIPEMMAHEIKCALGVGADARFKKNRRAGSPV